MFKKAVPVYAENLSDKMNTHIMLKEDISSLVGCIVKITASSFYKLYVNDTFVAFGPARTAKGYARVDRFELSSYDNGKQNQIRIEVVGYNCSSYYTPKQPSFVICEIEKDDEVIVYTGRNFLAYVMNGYIQKTRRFSGQRCFTEVKDFRFENTPVRLAEVPSPIFLDRVVPYPSYNKINTDKILSGGVFIFDSNADTNAWKFDGGNAEDWGFFDEEKLDYSPFTFVKSLKQTKTFEGGCLPKTLSEGEYLIIDLDKIEVGFVKLLLKANYQSDIVVAFSEYLTSDVFEFGKIDCENVLEYVMPEGEYNIESFDVYAMRYLAVFVKSGEIELKNVGLKAYEFNTYNIDRPDYNDEKLKTIYDAAVRTFAHNAVDLYTDCPSRERAGWLCDSYFTAKTEYFLTGKSDVEKAFLENYRLFENDGKLPEGVLPMCYPSDVPMRDKFIPQWNMWYVLEVEEFLLKRSTDTDKELFRSSVIGIADFLSLYENGDGLLEKLPEWNFVEWSKANEWTQDVNYPTNFLYAELLDAVYRLYGNEEYKQKAEIVRKKTAELSFNGEVFTDNAVRNANGVLENTNNISETCQYYAVLFGKIDLNDQKYSALKNHIENGFKDFKEEYAPINAFIGFYLRMLVLLNMEKYDLLLSDIKDFFYNMAKTTGTLWEYKEGLGSRDHGFASFVAYVIDKAVKGTK